MSARSRKVSRFDFRLDWASFARMIEHANVRYGRDERACVVHVNFIYRLLHSHVWRMSFSQCRPNK